MSVRNTGMSVYALLVLFAAIMVVRGDYMVTIYPEFLRMGDLTNFHHDRWLGKSGLDWPQTISKVKQLGVISNRWVNTDLRDQLFEKAPEDPHRKGYPDPAYFKQHEHSLAQVFVQNLQAFGNPEIVMDILGTTWPHWIDTSQHLGLLPTNIDAAAEFVFLLIQSIYNGANGKLPVFYEGINEPDWFMKKLDWATVLSFYRAVAHKVKLKYPQLRLGGPTITAASGSFDKDNYKVWKQLAQFLDMAFTNGFDFLSFHSYINMDMRGGGHQFYFNSESKVCGLLDLIESYAHKKTGGNSIDVVVTEFGLGTVTGTDAQKPSNFIQWANIYQYNALLFAFLEHRDVMRKAIGYLMTHYEGEGYPSIRISLFDKNTNERDASQTIKFWRNIKESMKFLRVDSQFHGAQRQIIPHALVDPGTGSLMVLLHNHDTKPTRVRLNFNNGWFHPSSAQSTCEYLSGQKTPVLEAGKTVHITNSVVTVPAEASCYFQFHTTHNFAHAPTITQRTFYGANMIIPIQNTVDVKVYLPALNKLSFARLRFSVSLTDKSANPKPKSVQLNNHQLTSFYSLHTQHTYFNPTLFETYEYIVPVNVLRHPTSDVKLTFNQKGGYLSSVAIVYG